jgi:glutamine amidotransferase
MTGATIAILDYGAGNVASVVNAFRHLDAGVRVTSSSSDLTRARGIVVPGVGHFSRTAAIARDVREAIAAAIDARTPVLGICLGLHWLFDGSAESAGQPGAGVFSGRCAALESAPSIKVPHVGWNSLTRTARRSTLLAGVEDDPFVYFCHSYAAPPGPDTAAVSHHGRDFAAVVERDRAFGVQFHPEKSGAAGLRILRNFIDLCAERSRPC